MHEHSTATGPVALTIDNPNGSQELYERIRQEMALPAGGHAHVAGPRPEGGWRVVEVFDSEEEARTFLRERLGPALRAAGVDGPPPPHQIWPVHHYAVAQPAASAG